MDEYDFFRIFLLLHILAAIVGFGSVFLNGVYAAQAKAIRGPEGLAIAKANLHVSEKWGTKFIYAVPVFGILAIVTSDDLYEFSDTWISASFVLYIAAIGTSHGFLIPRVKKIHGLMEEMLAGGPPPQGAPPGPPPQVVKIEALGKQVGMAGASLDIALIVMLWLMIFRPGA